MPERDHLTDEQVSKIERWIESNEHREIGLVDQHGLDGEQPFATKGTLFLVDEEPLLVAETLTQAGLNASIQCSHIHWIALKRLKVFEDQTVANEQQLG